MLNIDCDNSYTNANTSKCTERRRLTMSMKINKPVRVNCKLGPAFYYASAINTAVNGMLAIMIQEINVAIIFDVW